MQSYRSYVENIARMPNVIDYSTKVSGNLTIAERAVEYDGNLMYNTAVCEMQDEKVKKATQYFAAPFEAPGWQAQWIERM